MLRIFLIAEHIIKKHGLTYWMISGTLLGTVRHQGFIPWDDDLDIAMPREDFEKFIAIAAQELPSDLFLQTYSSDPMYKTYGIPCKIRDTRSRISESNKEYNGQYDGLFIDIFPMDKYHKRGLAKKKDIISKKWMERMFRFHHRVPTSERSIRGIGRNIAYQFKNIIRSEYWIKLYIDHHLLKLARKNSKLAADYYWGFAYDMPWFRLYEPSDIFPLKALPFEGVLVAVPNNYDAVLRQSYGNYMKIPEATDQVSHTSSIIIDKNL